MVATPIPFKHVWAVDFEYRAIGGNPPRLRCMVAVNCRTGQVVRLWRNELHSLSRAPFDVGSDSVVAAFYASAEWACFRVLGWPLPVNCIDLFAEHRCRTNGIVPASRQNNLLMAGQYWGIPTITNADKVSGRSLAMLDDHEYDEAKQRLLLDYCETDTWTAAKIFAALSRDLNWPQALNRGRYTRALSFMELRGSPIDRPLYLRLAESWSEVKLRLIGELDEHGVFDGVTFKHDRFAALLVRKGSEWPIYPASEKRNAARLVLDDEAFRDMANRYSWVVPIKEARSLSSKMRLVGLPVGDDGFNRCLLSPFQATTGRNQPSPSNFIFGPSRWMRALIRPPEGYGIAYVDFSAQEIGLASALSGDERMMDDYLSGDPHINFAIRAKLAPPGATKRTHHRVRNMCKATNLGVNYGMGRDTLSIKLGIGVAAADTLLRLHKRVYETFWRWADDEGLRATARGVMSTVFGWHRRLAPGDRVNMKSVRNFPVQANANEMLRAACVAGVEAGLTLCCPVHDALLLMSPLNRLDEDIAHLRYLMGEAGRVVSGGLTFRTDKTEFRWPDRFTDDGVAAMWNRVLRVLAEVDGRSTAEHCLPG